MPDPETDFTAEQEAALVETIASGVTSTRYGDRGITYASPEELYGILQRIRRERRGRMAYRSAVAGYRRFT